jgi:hypothetical protein
MPPSTVRAYWSGRLQDGQSSGGAGVSGDVVTFVGLGFLITTNPFGETDGRFGGSEELGGRAAPNVRFNCSKEQPRFLSPRRAAPGIDAQSIAAEVFKISD